MTKPIDTTGTRRAAALFLHYTRGDAVGFNAVVEELENGADARDLVLGLLSLWTATVPQIVTPLGQRCIESLVLDLARDEGPDCG